MEPDADQPAPQSSIAANAEAALYRFAAVVNHVAEMRTGGGALGVIALILSALTVVFIPVAIVIGVRRRLRREFWQSGLSNLLDGGVATFAYPIMVNRMLLSEGNQLAPGLFLISPDADQAADVGFHASLIIDISAPDTLDIPPVDKDFCDALFADEQFTPGRMRLIPESLTKGKLAVACDMVVDPMLIESGKIDDANFCIPCVFNPRSGMVAIMPTWIMRGETPPPTLAGRFADYLQLLFKLHRNVPVAKP